MTSYFVTDSDEEAIVELILDHEELYDKTHNFLQKARKDSLQDMA